MTTPSCVGSAVSLSDDPNLEAGRLGARTRRWPDPDRGRPGLCAVCGPFETLIWTVSPFGLSVPGSGSWATTRPFRRIRVDQHGLGDEPRRPELRLGALACLLEHVGHGRELLTLGDRQRRRRALLGLLAGPRVLLGHLALGSVRRKYPLRRPAEACVGEGLRRLVEAACPRPPEPRPAPVPTETRILTVLPFSIRVPPSGFWSITLPRSSAVPTPVWTSAWKPCVLDLLDGELSLQADHVRHRDLGRPELVLDLGVDVPAGDRGSGEEQDDERARAGSGSACGAARRSDSEVDRSEVAAAARRAASAEAGARSRWVGSPGWPRSRSRR